MKKKVISILLIFALVAMLLPLGAYASSSGECADGCKWNLDNSGLLSITANYPTAMQDYRSDSPPPWFDLRNGITSVYIGDGITSIGDYAFYECSGMESVVLPESLTRIGQHAFHGCSSLHEMNLPPSIAVIGFGALEYCEELSDITIPQGVRAIAGATFYSCKGLRTISLPESIRTIEFQAFDSCMGLTDVYYNGSQAEWNQIRIGSTNLPLTSASIHFGRSSYVVTFDPNGGTVDVTDKTLVNGDTYGELPNAARSGYDFLGWFTERSAGTQITPASTVRLSANLRLYAHWAVGGAPSSGDVSGDIRLRKLSKDDIRQLLKDNPTTPPAKIFVEEPSCKSPYKAGKLSEEAIDAATNRLNALRRIAGLNPVKASPERCENAQYGAVLLAASDRFSHTPPQPADMDDAFYDKGVRATMISNLAGGIPFLSAIDALMDDSAWNTIGDVGHRRWLLNPKMDETGFGYAIGEYDGEEEPQTVIDILHRGYADCDYRYISWPPSGNFPKDIMSADASWSLSLNPEYYAAPVKSEIRVSIAGEKNNKIWEMDSSTTGMGFVAVLPAKNTVDFGGTHGIVFRPELDEEDLVNGYSGKYTVSVYGLKDRAGRPTKLSFDTDFFNINPDSTDKPSPPIQTPSPAPPPTPSPSDFSDIEPNAYYTEAVAWAVDQGITSGTSATTFSPNAACTRGQIVTFLWNAAGKPEPTANRNPFVDVNPSHYYYKPVLWALENRITSGTDASHFSPSQPCTRGQSVTFLWRANGSPVPQTQNHFTDVNRDSYYDSAVSWALENSVTSGVNAAHFAPENKCARGQIVTFLYRSHSKAAIHPLESLPDGDYVLTLSKDTIKNTRRGPVVNSHLVYKICLNPSYADSLQAGNVIPLHKYGYNDLRIDWIQEESIPGDPSEYRKIATHIFMVKGAAHMPEYIPLEMRDTEPPWQLWAEGDYMLDSYFYRSSPVSLVIASEADFYEVATVDYGASPRKLSNLSSFFSGQYSNKWVNMMVTVKNGQVTYGKILRGTWDNEPFPLVLK